MAKADTARIVAFSDLGFSIKIRPDAAITDAKSAAEATLSWEPQIVLDGNVLPFNRENALVLYQRLPRLLGELMDRTDAA